MAVAADISVILPARDDGPRVAATVLAMARARATDARLEFIIADDLSDRPAAEALRAAAHDLERLPKVEIRVVRLNERSGLSRARNHAAALAGADILLLTDAHARISSGWDSVLFEHLGSDTVVAGTVAHENTAFRAFGASLVAPAMGMRWNTKWPDEAGEVEIASSAATGLQRSLFQRLGGYDPGFLVHGAADPEFSIRAWLMGAHVHVRPELEVTLGFRPRAEREAVVAEGRAYAVHNALRFGLLYFSEPGCLQLLRYHALHAPDLFAEAIGMVADSDIWDRRKRIESRSKHPFAWFAERFDLRDPLGGAVW